MWLLTGDIYYGGDAVYDVRVCEDPDALPWVCEVVVEYVEEFFENPDALVFHETVVDCVVGESPGHDDVVYEGDVAVYAGIDGAVEMVFLMGLFLFYEDLGGL